MKVFSYYEPLGLNDAEALRLIWEKAWRDKGFEPLILGPDDIPVDLRAIARMKFATYPTINPPGYDLACFMRWAAFVVAAQKLRGIPALFSDLDVVPVLTAAVLRQEEQHEHIVFMEKNRVPCLVMADALGLGLLLDILLAGPVIEKIDGHPHCSDMTIFARLASVGITRNLCREYLDDSWQSAGFIHFPFSRTGPDKVAAIQKFLS